MEVYGIIYLLIDGTNDMEYVGQTIRSVKVRFREHRREESRIGRAIRAHGADMFVIAILKVCYSPEELSYWERHFIKSRDTMAPNGYNLTEGGERNFRRSPETCKKISLSHSGKNHYNYGKSLSEEHKAKLSVALSGEKNPFFGKHHTKKSKNIISCALTGKKLSDEHKANISASGKGKAKSDVTKSRMSVSCKTKRAVICIEEGIVYESLTMAGRLHKIHYTAILRACNNPLFTSCGMHWRFVEEVPDGTEIEIPANSRTRPVICLETGERFNSIKEAGQHYNINPSNISRVCRNPNYKAAGYHFRHADEIPDGVEIEIPPDLPKKTTNRAVICVETGEQFNSLAEASRHYNIDASRISKACRNANKTCGGFHWRYVDSPQA